MVLEVKHLAPYLPYGLKLKYVDRNVVQSTGIMKSISHNDCETYPTRVGINYQGEEHIWMLRPMLRPLSLLSDEIEHNGERFVPIDWLEDKYYTLSLHKECERLMEDDGHKWFNHISYLLASHLLEWHFDVFGLIPAGLATELS